MRKLTARLRFALCAASLPTTVTGVAQQGPLIFLSCVRSKRMCCDFICHLSSAGATTALGLFRTQW